MASPDESGVASTPSWVNEADRTWVDRLAIWILTDTNQFFLVLAVVLVPLMAIAGWAAREMVKDIDRVRHRNLGLWPEGALASTAETANAIGSHAHTSTQPTTLCTNAHAHTPHAHSRTPEIS